MKKKSIIAIVAIAVAVPALVCSAVALVENGQEQARPTGPCDVYAEGGTPCAAAHSSTRALYAGYNGPLYQIQRQSDGKTLDIGVVQPSATDGGGYADAAAQDAFCADTYCWFTILYDQSGNENHLVQAPRGGFSGQAMGGFNNVPMADWAPVTLNGHKVYGIFITAGMGLRWNDAKGTAVDDQAQGQYWVINGHHYNSGCCFDYGNAETDSRDDGDGTMETTYFGNQRAWYYGSGPGPWLMTDQENNLVGCVNPDPNDKYCENLKSITWRFVTETTDGEPHHWRSMGGDAQEGDLQTLYDGGRIINPRNSYDPMRKQGAILLGNGGDNSNGSSGTFYEAAMTAAGTFPSKELNQKVQANVVSAKYDVQRLAVTAADKTDIPNGLQTFVPGSNGSSTVTFINTTGKAILNLELSLQLPSGWKATLVGSKDKVKTVNYTVNPGQTVVATFTVTSGKKPFNGDMVAQASWKAEDGLTGVDKAIQKVRNVPAVKINEFRVSDGVNTTNSFIELFNAGDKAVDISGWSLTQHAVNIPSFSDIVVPKGTVIAPRDYYVFGLSTSGLSVDAAKGDKVIYVRSIAGIEAGHSIEIGTGSNKEIRKVAKVNNSVAAPEVSAAPMMRGAAAAGVPTTVWQPLPEGPVITIPAGSNNIPVTSVAHFKVGDKMAIGYGAKYPAVSYFTEKYEVVTVTEVGQPGTQAWLSMDAKPGDTNIKVSSTANITAGDKIRLDIESVGHGIEWVTVKSVGTPSVRSSFNGPLAADEDPGTGLELEQPLKYAHSSNMPFAVNGTGITFEPATKFDHSSNEPVLALVYSIELDAALSEEHSIDDVVYDANVTTAGYVDEVAADQLFGGPTLSTSRGNITLRNAKGMIVESVNYGGVVDPWLSEGYQAVPGSGEEGNYAPTPFAGGQRYGAPTTTAMQSPNLSSGRYPDGIDSDDNELDFNRQLSFNTAAAIKAGSNNIKVLSTAGLIIGQRIVVGQGEKAEDAIVATIGSTGATLLTQDAPAGTTKLAVVSSQGFTKGTQIELSWGLVYVDKVEAAPRRYRPEPGAPQPVDYIYLTEPLKQGLKAGFEFAGTGLGLSNPLKYDHAQGTVVVSYIPTPGKPNKY